MSAKMSAQVSLLNFFVFNSTFGPKEGQEEDRILFYHPAGVGIDTKIRQIGLCEGIIKFTSTFNSSPIDSVHTQKTRQLYYQPEQDFWIVMTINVPCIEKILDGAVVYEYQEEEIQDEVYQAILVQTYQAFRLFNGTMVYVLSKSGKIGLIQHLVHFFNKYLSTIQLNQIGVLEMFNGIQYLPLDKHTYARIQTFLNQLKASIPQVAFTILLHNDQQIWSDMDQDDTRIMFNFLSSSLFPAASLIESQGNPSSLNSGWFLIGPANMADESSLGPIPKVHLTGGNENTECFLLVYRINSTTLCLLVNGEFQITFDFLRKVHGYCATNLHSISVDIVEHCPKKQQSVPAGETHYKYIYFNRMNMAEKTSAGISGTKSRSLLPDNVLKLIGNIYTDFNSMTDLDDGEIIAKLSSDTWVIGKKSDHREVYILINQKNSNLTEINEEVKKVCAANFSNIFFQD